MQNSQMYCRAVMFLTEVYAFSNAFPRLHSFMDFNSNLIV